MSSKTDKVRVRLHRITPSSYDIALLGNDKSLAGKIKALRLPVGRYVIITDLTIKKLHGQALIKLLRKSGLAVSLIAFPGGEQSKNQTVKTRMDAELLRARHGRDTAIIALGGGVVGDMAGFVAATYMRGIPYVQVPTTLLGMLDSSIGGKTGIDTPYGKNMIGAFWQPRAVYIVTDYLKTLPRGQIINGLVEALKMFLTHQPKALDLIAQSIRHEHKSQRILKRIIKRAVSIKASVISKDEREAGPRALLNFGHTIGHALERLSNYSLAHGYATGLGILVESRMSFEMGLLKPADYKNIESLVASLGIDSKIIRKYSAAAIINATCHDKKTLKGQVRYILLDKPGQAHQNKSSWAHKVPDSVIARALKYFY